MGTIEEAKRAPAVSSVLAKVMGPTTAKTSHEQNKHGLGAIGNTTDVWGVVPSSSDFLCSYRRRHVVMRQVVPIITSVAYTWPVQLLTVRQLLRPYCQPPALQEGPVWGRSTTALLVYVQVLRDLHPGQSVHYL